MYWYKAESGIRPSEVDTTLSKIYNYVRRNIKEIKKFNLTSEESVTMYEYEEAKINKDDWELYQDLMAITPYTETKTAYYGEKEKTFYDVPNGNLTVYFDNYNGSYSVSRIANRVTVSFDTLTESTNITISVN